MPDGCSSASLAYFVSFIFHDRDAQGDDHCPCQHFHTMTMNTDKVFKPNPCNWKEYDFRKGCPDMGTWLCWSSICCVSIRPWVRIPRTQEIKASCSLYMSVTLVLEAELGGSPEVTNSQDSPSKQWVLFQWETETCDIDLWPPYVHTVREGHCKGGKKEGSSMLYTGFWLNLFWIPQFIWFFSFVLLRLLCSLFLCVFFFFPSEVL